MQLCAGSTPAVAVLATSESLDTILHCQSCPKALEPSPLPYTTIVLETLSPANSIYHVMPQAGPRLIRIRPPGFD
jgi:hypothetical protein